MGERVNIPQSIEALEDALVRWHELWWRSPGDGRSPWAKDGPWYLAQGEVGDVKGDWSTTLLVNEAGRELEVRKVDSRAPRPALDAAEVAERDRIGLWLELVPGAAERRLLVAASHLLFRGAARVPWVDLARALRWDRSTDALALAYRRELARLLCRLHGRPQRFWREYAGRAGLVAEPRGRAAMVVLGDVAGEG